MVSLKSILFFAITATAAVVELEERTPATILADIKVINQNTTALTATVKNWDGSSLGSFSIAGAERDLENSIKKATADAGKEKVAACPASNRIINYITNTLEPNIRKSFAALKSRKADFDKRGLTNTVLNDLKTLKNLTDQLGAALLKITCAASKPKAQALIKKIDADFNNAIAYFSQ